MNDWDVYLQASAPEGVEIDEDTILNRAARLGEVLADHGAAPAANNRGWSVQLTVAAEDPFDAVAVAHHLVTDELPTVGLPTWPFTRLEVFVGDDETISADVLPEMVGTREITALLGISRQRLHELRTLGRFPEPVLEISGAPIWLAAAVRTFETNWDRRPGRARRTATPPRPEPKTGR